jgi:CRISPR-associated protein Cas1
MKNLYLFKQGTELRRKNNQLVVYKENKKLASYPLTIFENLFLFGNINIKSSAMNFLISNKKGVVFLTETGFFRGYLLKRDEGSNINNRIKQYEIYFSEKKKLMFMKQIIYSKLKEIENNFLIDLEREETKLMEADKRDEILGIEGIASNKMFREFGNLLENDLGIKFKGRDYHPPKDEINSLLSSIYTFFYNLLIPIFIKNGYDVFLGLLHSKRGTHYAFISDVIEIIRPSLTYTVYEYLKVKDLNDIKFIEIDKGNSKGLYLERESLKEFFKWLFLEDKIDLNLDKTNSIIKKVIDTLAD